VEEREIEREGKGERMDQAASLSAGCIAAQENKVDS